MDDTIYREAAIYAVMAGSLSAATVFGRTEHGMTALEETIRAIKELPSAQPELIRCKDCKFTDGDGPIADGRYWCVLHGSFMYFCSDAERRTDE